MKIKTASTANNPPKKKIFFPLLALFGLLFGSALICGIWYYLSFSGAPVGFAEFIAEQENKNSAGAQQNEVYSTLAQTFADKLDALVHEGTLTNAERDKLTSLSGINDAKPEMLEKVCPKLTPLFNDFVKYALEKNPDIFEKYEIAQSADESQSPITSYANEITVSEFAQSSITCLSVLKSKGQWDYIQQIFAANLVLARFAIVEQRSLLAVLYGADNIESLLDWAVKEFDWLNLTPVQQSLITLIQKETADIAQHWPSFADLLDAEVLKAEKMDNWQNFKALYTMYMAAYFDSFKAKTWSQRLMEAVELRKGLHQNKLSLFNIHENFEEVGTPQDIFAQLQSLLQPHKDDLRLFDDNDYDQNYLRYVKSKMQMGAAGQFLQLIPLYIALSRDDSGSSKMATILSQKLPHDTFDPQRTLKVKIDPYLASLHSIYSVGLNEKDDSAKDDLEFGKETDDVTVYYYDLPAEIADKLEEEKQARDAASLLAVEDSDAVPNSDLSPAAPAGDALENTVKTAPDGTILIAQADVDLALADPEAIFLHMIPNMQDGKLAGIKITSADLFLEKLGLKGHDILMTVNGHTPPDLEAALEQQAPFTIEIERQGKSITLDVEIVP